MLLYTQYTDMHSPFTQYYWEPRLVLSRCRQYLVLRLNKKRNDLIQSQMLLIGRCYEPLLVKRVYDIAKVVKEHGHHVSLKYRRRIYYETSSAVARAASQWRHNESDGVSNHQPHHCLLNRQFGCRSKKISKLRVTGLCAGNSPETGEFPAQMASNAENVSIWWRHYVPRMRPITGASQNMTRKYYEYFTLV